MRLSSLVNSASAFTFVASSNMAAVHNADGSWTIALTGKTPPIFQLYADQFENPNNASWKVNSLAPAVADPASAFITVRAFDDTTEEGVGFSNSIPLGSVNMRLTATHRASSGSQNASVVTKLYVIPIQDNTASNAWTTGTVMTSAAVVSGQWQYDTWTLDLATIGATAGLDHSFEFTRVGTNDQDTLTGDWFLRKLEVTFTE